MLRLVLIAMLVSGAANAACRGGYATANGCVPYDRSETDRAVEDHYRWMEDRRRDELQRETNRDVTNRLDRIERRLRP